MPKEEMNAFDVRALVGELQVLDGGRFDKAYQPNREEVMLRFYVGREHAGAIGGAGTKKDLLIHTGQWMCLTKHPPENPIQPPQFSRVLRKHVSGGRVLAVRQHAFDRVVEIDVGKREGTFTLVVELFHDGNVILVKRPGGGGGGDDAGVDGGGPDALASVTDGDADANPDPGEGDADAPDAPAAADAADGAEAGAEPTIVAALLMQRWAHRTIRPGAAFKHPPARVDPFSLDYDAFRAEVLESDADAVRTLATELNLGGVYAEEVCHRAGVDKNTPVRDLLESQVRDLYDALAGLTAAFESGDLDPVVVMDGDEPVDVAPHPLAKHHRDGLTLERFATFNAALDRYFSRPQAEERHDKRWEKFQQEKGKVERRLHQQEKAIERFDRDEAEYKAKGDLVYAHFDTVQKTLDTLLGAGRELGWDAVRERLKQGREAGNADAERVASINPHEGKVTLRLPEMDGGGTEKVTLDLRKSVQENAEALYERSKKAREKRAGASQAIGKTRARLREMEEKGAKLVEQMEEERAKAEATKRFWFERYRWFRTSGGHLVLGGRDASSNEKVVKKHLEDNDRYVHADVHGAPSVVVKAKDGETPAGESLEQACHWAAAMSKAWKAGHGSGEAYWVTPHQVSKTPQAGEYLAKGAFVIRGKRNYVAGPLRVAVGEVQVDGSRKVMGGPVDAVTAQSEKYVVLEPGRESPNAVAARLADAFEVPVEEVQGVLPPGGCRVAEVYGLPEGDVTGE